MRVRTLARAALAAAVALPASLQALPATAGVPPMWAYAVVRDPTDTAGYNLPGKDFANSAIGRINARKTENGSVELRISGFTFSKVNLLVTPLSAAPRACAVGSWAEQPGYLQVTVECADRHGLPKDTPFVLSARSLRAGHGHVAYLYANQPALPGYIPPDTSQMNGTDPFALNSVTKLGTGRWEVTLPDLGAPAGTVQVSSKAGIPARCGVVSWLPEVDDEVVIVRCRGLDGAPLDTRFTLWYAKGQGLASSTDRRQAYLFANRPAAASYHPTFRFTSESGKSTVVRQGKGRYLVTLPHMAKGGAAHVTPVGGGTARCNVSSIRRTTLPQKVGVRCWNAAGALVDAKFTLAYVR